MNMQPLAIDYVDEHTHEKFHFPIDVFKYPSSQREYDKLQKLLDELIDIVRDNEDHQLCDIMEIIGDNLERYDNEHYPPIEQI